MGFLKKFLRQFGTADGARGPQRPQKTQREETGDSLDDLRRKLESLPADTRRDLLQTYGDAHSASVRASVGVLDRRPGLGVAGGRRATSPNVAPAIVEDEQYEGKQKEITAEGYAWSLMETEDLPDLKEVKALHKALKKADEEWVETFRDSGGMGGIYKAMAGLAESREAYMEDGDDNNDHEVPEEEVQLEEELVRCVMNLLNRPLGLLSLEASAQLLPLLAGSAMDSSSVYVKCNLLKLLTIMAESGASGFESVLNALDYQKVERDQQFRFTLLVEAFADADSSGVALVTDLIVFFNTVISSAFEFEERVLLRTEMINAGILEAMSRIRDYYGLSKGDEDDATEYAGSERSMSRGGSMKSESSVSTILLDTALTSETNDLAAQLDLFDTVMLEDRKDAIATGMMGEEEEQEAVAEEEEREEEEEVPTMNFAEAISMLIDGDASDTESETDKLSGQRAGGQQEVVTVVEYPPDPPAVASMRSLVDKVQEKAEILNMVTIIAEKLESMADAQCDINKWKMIRDAVSNSLSSTLMDSDDSDSDDESNLPDPSGSESTVAPLPAPATGIPPVAAVISPPAERPKSLLPKPALPARPTSSPTTAPAALPVGVTAKPIPTPPGGPQIPAAPALRDMPTPGAIPTPPALPGMPAAAAIPAPPPLPGMPAYPATAAIPAPPPLPGMPAAIPAPPPLPGMLAAIPAPPPLPGMRTAIPAPPPLPGLTATIPSPPPLPGMPAVRPIPAPHALPGMQAAGAIPAPPALPGVSARGAIPTPPALPGMGGGSIPPPPPLPGMARGPPMPPPLPGMGGPPMPPPLPGMGGLRAPPMPPTLGMPARGPVPPALPKKPPGPKRRPVHWEKIAPTQLAQTVFSEIDPSSVDLPTDLLMDAFVEKPKEKKPLVKDDAKGVSAVDAKKKANEQVSLLDSKVLRNNGIVLKLFRTKPYDLRDSIVAMDLDKFDTDKLIALRGIAPSDEDLPTLKGYDGDLKKIDEVTLFMVLTAKIPRYRQRLDCALFMKGFAHDADFLSGKLRLVDKARKEVVESPRLKRLIEVVLAMGNYLNEGTRNGEARAIKFSSLLKLDTVKTMDKKKTLLHVLMGWAKQKEPEILLLDEDLVHAQEASQWSLTDLKNQVTQLVLGFNLMQNQLKMAQGAANPLEGDRFSDVVEPFLNSAKGRMEALEAEYGQVQGDYDSCARRFGEDPTKTSSGDFFSLVSALVDTIAVALRENDMAAKAEERRKKREAQEQKRQALKAKKALDAKASEPPARLGSAPSRGGLAGRGLASRKSVRPSMHGVGLGARGMQPSGRGLSGAPSRSGVRPLGLGVNEAMLRRNLIATEADSDESDEDSDLWEEEEGAIKDEYERIKNQRVTEAVMLRNISKLKDPSKREFARGMLPYQKSTLGRQQSMARPSGGPAMLQQVSAIKQASNLRQLSAIRQASMVMGPRRAIGGRAPSVLRPSPPRDGIGARSGLSTGRLEARGMPGGSFSRQPSDTMKSLKAFGGDMGGDRRKQFKTLKSTAFLA